MVGKNFQVKGGTFVGGSFDFFFRVLVFEQVRREVLRFGCDIYNKYFVVPHVIWRLMTTLAPRDFTGIHCNYMLFIFISFYMI